MANYIKNSQTVETHTQVIKEIQTIQPSQPEKLDVGALANAISQAINIRLPQNNTNNTGQVIELDDSFDSSNTLGRIAEQMLVERGENKANFADLGNVKTTKRDKADVDNTIDLLSKLDN